VIAIIPARGGSTRIPRKNIRAFYGKPIISYSIEAARETDLFDRILVSTDDEEIAGVAREWGADVYMRDPEYARDEIGTQEVVWECLQEINYRGPMVCCIYPTAPMMRAADLKRGFEALTGNHTYAFAVGTDPLRDAGMFYWGWIEMFLDEEPLISTESAIVPIDEKYVCDINVESDWTRAVAMYGLLHL
jgi:N-acylneuraminate cytidylyltransferase